MPILAIREDLKEYVILGIKETTFRQWCDKTIRMFEKTYHAQNLVTLQSNGRDPSTFFGYARVTCVIRKADVHEMFINDPGLLVRVGCPHWNIDEYIAYWISASGKSVTRIDFEYVPAAHTIPHYGYTM